MTDASAAENPRVPEASEDENSKAPSRASEDENSKAPSTASEDENEKKVSELSMACIEDDLSAVESCLKEVKDVNKTSYYNYTPLHLASIFGHEKIVEALAETTRGEEMVQDQKIDLNAVNEEGQTALNIAAYYGHTLVIEILLRYEAKVDIEDNDGWTPLMSAVKQKHFEVMRQLLEHDKGSQVSIMDKENQTPLSVAIQKDLEAQQTDSLNCVELLMDYVYPNDLSDSGPCNRPIPSDDDPNFINVISWAGANLKRSVIAREFLYKNDSKSPHPRSAIEWASLSEKPGVLWWLIAISPHDFETTQCVDEAIEQLREQGKWFGTQEATTEVKRGKPRNKAGEKKIAPDSIKFQEAKPARKENEDLQAVSDILLDPPFAQFCQDTMPSKMPDRSDPNTENCNAHIIGFFNDENTSSTIRRVRSVETTVYKKGPKEIIENGIEDETKHMNRANELVKVINPQHGSTSIGSQIYKNENNHKFTWVHLPATNIQWMEDLLLKIAQEDSEIGDDYNKLNSFLKNTWFEIPDRTSKSRIMRPQFVERPKVTQDIRQTQSQAESNEKKKTQELSLEGSNNEETAKGRSKGKNYCNSSAVYMPFLSFSTHFQSLPLNEGSTQITRPVRHGEDVLKRLKEARDRYEKVSHNGSISQDEQSKDNFVSRDLPVIHGSPTLDEAYYHFDSDKQSKDDKEYRNRNQVVTKYLNISSEGKPSVAGNKAKVESLPILRVNQIWIWTIANKWLVSAASYPVDDIEQLWIDGFIEHLNKAKGAYSQPSSVEEMMKEIISYCIGSFERRRSYKDLSQIDNKIDSKQSSKLIGGLSIRQVFSNYINSIGRKETELFDQIRDLIRAKESENKEADTNKQEKDTGRRDKKFGDAVNIAETLFSEVKDIRDELHIVQWIADCQEVVQKKLSMDDSTTSDLAASYILKDIGRMEKLASRIQEAANSTLSLLQNEIATFMAEESMKQGEESMKQGEESMKQGEESMKQGKESVKQGKILMVFTVATILFLPMSFLTSLFAMDADKLKTAPSWTFAVIFGSAIMFIIPFGTFTWLSVRDRSGKNNDSKKSKTRSKAQGSGLADGSVPNKASFSNSNQNASAKGLGATQVFNTRQQFKTPIKDEETG